MYGQCPITKKGAYSSYDNLRNILINGKCTVIGQYPRASNVRAVSVLSPKGQTEGRVTGTQKNREPWRELWENLGPLIKGYNWFEGSATEGEPGESSSWDRE